MKSPHLRLVSEPPKEDSTDLSEAEVALAVDTQTFEAFVQALEELIRPMIRPNVSGAIWSHELRRKGEDLYCRTVVMVEGEPDKTLVFRVNWMATL